MRCTKFSNLFLE